MFVSTFHEDISEKTNKNVSPVGIIKKPVRLENAKTIFTKFLSKNDGSYLSSKKPLKKLEQLLPLLLEEKTLVVDDDKTNQFIFEKMLSQIGYTSSVVGSGESALKELANSKFDLMLDYNLPDYKGSDLARQIRSSSKGGNSDIPILGVPQVNEKKILMIAYPQAWMLSLKNLQPL